MIFAVNGHIEKIYRGEKTQTRRLVKPVDWYSTVLDCVFTRQLGGRLRWFVEGEYAVQPGRSKPGVWVNPGGGICYRPELEAQRITEKPTLNLREAKAVLTTNGYVPLRIRLTQIRQQTLTDISEDDALAEGAYNLTCQYCHGDMYFERISIGRRGKISSRKEICKNCIRGKQPDTANMQFAEVWRDIHGPKSWKPVEVWALTFEAAGA